METAALTMNKFLTKAAVAHIPDINLARSFIANAPMQARQALKDSELQYPLFIKPNTKGSSIGMVKVHDENTAFGAFEEVLTADYAKQIIVEEYIAGTEYSIGAFMRAGEVVVLPPYEVLPVNEYFDFDSKYLSDQQIDITPAIMDEEAHHLLNRLVKAIFIALGCKGVVRIDFIRQHQTGRFFFLEINTIPGQTDHSFIPKQIRNAGYDLTSFFTYLVEEAYQMKPI